MSVEDIDRRLAQVARQACQEVQGGEEEARLGPHGSPLHVIAELSLLVKARKTR